MNNTNIKIEKLNYLYKNLPSSLIGVVAISTVIYFVLQGEVLSTNLNIWYGLVLAVSSIRLFYYINYKKTVIDETNLNKHVKQFSIFAYITALIWASIPLYILPENILYVIFLALMLAGLISGALVTMAINNTLYRLYAIITLLPFIVTLYIIEDAITTPIMITIIMFLILVMVSSKKISVILNNSIEVTHKNKNLIIELEKKAVEAQKASEAKSSFLSTMSHEIRTPLNAIIGLIKVLKKNEKDNDKYKYLDTIDQSSYTLLNIINDILDFSKIESGKFKLDFIEFNPKKELDTISELYSEAASENGVTLVNKISNNLPKYIKTDKLRLKQIISNLISNSIKFTPENKNIEFIANFNKESSSLYIEIKDEGIGIEKDKISYITKEFTQADGSTARKYGGTGLGLSIVIKLLKILNSELKIDSNIGEGSSFSFKLDVEVIDSKNMEYYSSDNENILFNNKKVLVAEDNKTNQMLIKLLLNEFNIDITIADDGLIVEDYFKKNNYDLILMDINMPHRNGIDAMKNINYYQKDFNKKIPIVALTANAVSGDKEKYIKDGFNDYLSKPLDNEQLILVLKKYLH